MKHPDATLLEQRLSKACPTTQHAAIIMALRDIVGVEKYGQTVDDNPLTAKEWIVHAVEEAADGLKYAIRAREEAEKLEMEVQALTTVNAALVEKVRELETWKESAMAVEREWDPNQLAAMLGGQPGESQRAVIQWKVPILVQRVKQLEAFVTDPHALWSNWLRGDIQLPAGIGDIRECSEKMKRFRSRWLAAHQELQKAEDRIERTEERVKRLEVAGDAMAMAEGCRCDGGIICKRCFERQNAWTKAKGQP